MTRCLTTIAIPLMITACAAPPPKVRQVGAVHSDISDGTTNGRVALALGHLRIGNVALALENFRRAAREDPTSAEALVGIAECYQQMGRPALARLALEQALALRPHEAGLYRALAGVSRSEGKVEEAAALEREALRRAAPAPAPASKVATAPVAASSRPTQAASVTIALPPPRPAPVPVATPTPAPRVTVALAPAVQSGPRLVRLSPGEIMLVSHAGSPFAGRRTEIASTDTIHAPLRILNAARIEGIAARTRALLAAQGVRDARVGNAPGRREDSELRFAAAERARAERIAASLPFAVRRVVRDGPLVLLLGRNAGRKG